MPSRSDAIGAGPATRRHLSILLSLPAGVTIAAIHVREPFWGWRDFLIPLTHTTLAMRSGEF